MLFGTREQWLLYTSYVDCADAMGHVVSPITAGEPLMTNQMIFKLSLFLLISLSLTPCVNAQGVFVSATGPVNRSMGGGRNSGAAGVIGVVVLESCIDLRVG